MATEACKFYPIGDSRRFERVNENLAVGSEIFKLEVHPRSDFKIEPIDNSLSDVNYFSFVELNDQFVAIRLNQSLEDLVDKRDPQNVLKFKLTCRGAIGSQVSDRPFQIAVLCDAGRPRLCGNLAVAERADARETSACRGTPAIGLLADLSTRSPTGQRSVLRA